MQDSQHTIRFAYADEVVRLSWPQLTDELQTQSELSSQTSTCNRLPLRNILLRRDEPDCTAPPTAACRPLGQNAFIRELLFNQTSHIFINTIMRANHQQSQPNSNHKITRLHTYYTKLTCGSYSASPTFTPAENPRQAEASDSSESDRLHRMKSFLVNVSPTASS
jgi:hypothetical protein